ncbi:hypothetical protein HBI56_113500 [Parastagonospora nodorum]|nr:hypothetical protein HBH52_117210 [Parastagonospora nodorum]KAH3984743.1 hypothetical protein HBH51_031440 [Parastagonospora nodorum]KAH4000625.1 hypothetical protein HBI10_104190 [Parastagonospora nodorum]KAH4026371.1 hypothetical protein HBI13_061420 [Parastagonospora nodorum]KAH4036435.1 hypothetical protein HBI09_072920 [Parastagonospora nodorum]
MKMCIELTDQRSRDSSTIFGECWSAVFGKVATHASDNSVETFAMVGFKDSP